MHSRVFLSAAIGAAVSFASASHAQDQSSTGQGADPMAMKGLAKLALHTPAEAVFREWQRADRQWTNQTAWQKGRDAGYEIQPDTALEALTCVLGAKAGIAHSIEQVDPEAQEQWRITYDAFEFLVYSHTGALGGSFELAEERITQVVPTLYERNLSEGMTLDRMQAATSDCTWTARLMWSAWSPKD
ncbi:MAG: hypothetical protein AAGH57_09850 [Pseudomonadota bacterium]